MMKISFAFLLSMKATPFNSPLSIFPLLDLAKTLNRNSFRLVLWLPLHNDVHRKTLIFDNIITMRGIISSIGSCSILS